jgi:TM2 domain-containing membrane protein YozV
LSFLLLGLGQIYVGKILRGLGIMVLGFVLAMVFILFFGLFGFVLYFVYWIWNIFDAYKLAQQYNGTVRSSGNRPW